MEAGEGCRSVGGFRFAVIIRSGFFQRTLCQKLNYRNAANQKLAQIPVQLIHPVVSNSVIHKNLKIYLLIT